MRLVEGECRRSLRPIHPRAASARTVGKLWQRTCRRETLARTFSPFGRPAGLSTDHCLPSANSHSTEWACRRAALVPGEVVVVERCLKSVRRLKVRCVNRWDMYILCVKGRLWLVRAKVRPASQPFARACGCTPFSFSSTVQVYCIARTRYRQPARSDHGVQRDKWK